MRIKRIVAGLGLVLILGGVANAQTESFSETVKDCTHTVNFTSDNYLATNRFAEFDAYVDATGNIRMIGTDAAFFEFEKCMSEHGQQLPRQTLFGAH